MPAVGMTGYRIDLDGLAIKRVRHEYRLSTFEGNAIAAVTDVIDGEALTHGGRR
jgi:hypothetical protein